MGKHDEERYEVVQVSIDAVLSLPETAALIGDVFDVTFSEDKEGEYEEFPAFIARKGQLRFVLLGIPDPEYDIRDVATDDYELLFEVLGHHDRHVLQDCFRLLEKDGRVAMRRFGVSGTMEILGGRNVVEARTILEDAFDAAFLPVSKKQDCDLEDYVGIVDGLKLILHGKQIEEGAAGSNGYRLSIEPIAYYTVDFPQIAEYLAKSITADGRLSVGRVDAARRGGGGTDE